MSYVRVISKAEFVLRKAYDQFQYIYLFHRRKLSDNYDYAYEQIGVNNMVNDLRLVAEIDARKCISVVDSSWLVNSI